MKPPAVGGSRGCPEKTFLVSDNLTHHRLENVLQTTRKALSAECNKT